MCHDTQDTQGSHDTQNRHDTGGNVDIQGSHETQGNIGSQQSPEIQDSCDTQEYHEYPATLFQSSVSDLSQQIICSSSLHQQAIEVSSSWADVLSELPLQALQSPLPQTPAQDPDICRSLSVRESICFIPGINESYKTLVCHNSQGSCDTLYSYEYPVCHKTQYMDNTQCSYETQSISISHDTQDSKRMCRSSSCIDADVSRATKGLQPCSLLPHHHDDDQGSHVSKDTQRRHDIQGNFDSQGHDTQECHESRVNLFQSSVTAVSQQLIPSSFPPQQALEEHLCEVALSQFPLWAPELPHLPIPDQDPDVCRPMTVLRAISLCPVISESCDRQNESHESQCNLGTQGSPEIQGRNQSPTTIFKSSVSGVRQQIISNNPLSQQAKGEPLFLADAQSQLPLQAPKPPHLPSHNEDPAVCRPLSVREAICRIPVIQGPPLPHPQLPAERLPQGNSSKAGFPGVSRPLCRPSLMENSELALELEVSEVVPETTLTRWVVYNQPHHPI